MAWRVLTGLGALALLVLSGCLPDSINPLGDPASAEPDPRLVGNWQGTLNEDRATLSVAAGEGAMLRIRLETTDQGGKTEWVGMEGFPGRMKKDRFVSVKMLEEQDKVYDPVKENYYICRYVISGDGSLTVWTMDEDMVVDAIAKGRINGAVDPTGKDRIIHITDSTVMIAILLEHSNLDRLFGHKFATFRRVSD